MEGSSIVWKGVLEKRERERKGVREIQLGEETRGHSHTEEFYKTLSPYSFSLSLSLTLSFSHSVRRTYFLVSLTQTVEMKDKRGSAGGSVVTVGDNNNKVAEDLVNRPKLGQNQSESRGQPLLPNTNCKTSSANSTATGATTTPAPNIYNNSTNAVPNHSTPNNSVALLSSTTAATGATLKATTNHVCSSSPKKPLKLRNHAGGVTELYDTLHNKVSHPNPPSGVPSSGSAVQGGQHYPQVSKVTLPIFSYETHYLTSIATT